jgi:hypothetical protein
VSSNFVANGYKNLEKEIRERMTKKYESDLNSARFLDRLRIKRRIKFEVNVEIMKLHEEISQESLFLKK